MAPRYGIFNLCICYRNRNVSSFTSESGRVLISQTLYAYSSFLRQMVRQSVVFNSRISFGYLLAFLCVNLAVDNSYVRKMLILFLLFTVPRLCDDIGLRRQAHVDLLYTSPQTGAQFSLISPHLLHNTPDTLFQFFRPPRSAFCM